jgi:3-isopropylmalate/(R)-2-methylmalate dehydratase small subunit
MEIAVTVLQSAGIAAVVAASFARSFYRNAINNGLVVLECDTSAIVEGDRLIVCVAEDSSSVRIVDRHLELPGAPLPAIMLRILEHGGLVPFLSAQGGFGPGVLDSRDA